MKYEFSNNLVRKLVKIKKSNKRLALLVKTKLEIFEIDPSRPSLRLHKLTGSMDNLWSISIDKSIRMIYYYRKEDTVVFVDIGKHEEVYKQ